ncbi:MAG: hypothetical protein M1839_002437 [Geoglossum umbratile]|nr:MAG: hypothetical protein M1839_002437 [Geoglossum umbratile]
MAHPKKGEDPSRAQEAQDDYSCNAQMSAAISRPEGEVRCTERLRTSEQSQNALGVERIMMGNPTTVALEELRVEFGISASAVEETQLAEERGLLEVLAPRWFLSQRYMNPQKPTQDGQGQPRDTSSLPKRDRSGDDGTTAKKQKEDVEISQGKSSVRARRRTA